jgi:hypothetical protein
MAPEKMDEMADDPREGPEAVVNAFLQHKSLQQMQDYLCPAERRLDHCCQELACSQTSHK